MSELKLSCEEVEQMVLTHLEKQYNIRASQVSNIRNGEWKMSEFFIEFEKDGDTDG